jgi:hypothetical protein
MTAASDPSSTWNMLTAIGTLALAFVTVFSTGIAVWLPRTEARRQQNRAEATEQRKCNVADIQLKSWSEQSDSGRIVHVGWPSWYSVRPVVRRRPLWGRLGLPASSMAGTAVARWAGFAHGSVAAVG